MVAISDRATETWRCLLRNVEPSLEEKIVCLFKSTGSAVTATISFLYLIFTHYGNSSEKCGKLYEVGGQHDGCNGMYKVICKIALKLIANLANLLVNRLFLNTNQT